MTLNEFKKIFEEDIVMLDEGEVVLETILDDLEDWDSMAVVSLNASLDEHFGFTLNEHEIKQLEVYGNIVNLIEKKKSNQTS